MVSIALSMPLTTLVMLPVTCRIVTAVSTCLLLTRKAEQVERLDLLLDCVRGVYPRAIIIALLQRLRPNKLRIQL
jgi:hypothetical protein